MKIAELHKLLKAGEWNDVEFKEARTDVPKSAFETVSAFANTHGGRLVFGVGQRGDVYEVTGLEKPDKVQNDFLSVLQADAKINHDVAVTEQKLDIGGKTVLVFQVAENQRTRKPVYLDGDIRRTFLRKGGGDYKAQMRDIERMLRDATADRWDSQPFGRVSLKDVFHPGSLKWYLRDGIQLWNPGDVFGDDSRLWEPGEKEVRNPSIAMAMRRIAMCEQAGTGLRMMREAWRKLGHPSPTYKNDRAGKAFELFIPELDKEVDKASDLVKAMFGGSPHPKAHDEAHDEAHDSDHVADHVTDHVADHVTDHVSHQIIGVLRAIDGELSRKKLQSLMKIQHRVHFYEHYLRPAITAGYIEMTIPDKPKSVLQKYRLTQKGRGALTAIERS